MRRQIILVGMLILSVFLTSVVSAEVWFNAQPESVYSIGDELKITAAVSDVGEQLRAELVCGSKSKLIFLKYLENENTVEILQLLRKSFLGNMTGECRIKLEYGYSYTESSKFRISDVVFVRTRLDKLDYAPEEKLGVSGEAEKANTRLLEGFFELHLEEINLSATGPVKQGKFGVNISLPANIEAGSYIVNITVYEKEGEAITNTGKTRLGAIIKQVPRRVDIALNSQSIKPGNNLSFRIMLYDQSERPIEGEASFLVESPEGKPLMKELSKMEESKDFSVEKNLPSGYYKIKAYSSGIYGEREFYVEENEEGGFKLINETLIVKNMGNVKYDKPIEVKIGGVVEIINNELLVGEEKKYQLKAPDGNYDVSVTDGRNSLASEGIALTGNVVSIKEMEGGFFVKNKSFAWLFLILVMGMFIFTASRRALKKRFVLSDRTFTGKKRQGVGAGVVKVGKQKERREVAIVKDPREAEHSLILSGQKQDTALICLKIKNELTKQAKISLDKILEKVYENKAVIYKTGEYVMPIFSPLVTKTFKNHVPAVKTALELSESLQSYNSKFSDKIDFGISVHSGDTVGRFQENKLKFTSLGNTITLAKKLAELSERDVLLSKEIHEKTIPEVKTYKTEKRGIEAFTVEKVIDTQKNKIFVQDFLKKLAGQQTGQNQEKNKIR